MTVNHGINGVVCEYLAAAWFSNNGYMVSWPFYQWGPYDLLIDDSINPPQRVQVKKIYYDNSKNRYIGSLVLTHKLGDGRSVNKKYNENDFDICAFVCYEHNAIYIVPFEKIFGRRSVTFYPDGSKPRFRLKVDFEQYKKQLINFNE